MTCESKIIEGDFSFLTCSDFRKKAHSFEEIQKMVWERMPSIKKEVKVKLEEFFS